MLGLKRIVIAQHERGLYLKNRSIQNILGPGAHWILDLFGRARVDIYDITVAGFNHVCEEVLVKTRPELCAQYFQVVDLGEQEVGLVYRDGKLADVLPPGTRQLYWKGLVDIRVEVLDISTDYAVPQDKLTLLGRARPDLYKAVAEYIVAGDVADQYVGLLIVDGQLVRALEPGLYAYWKFNRSIVVEKVDTRQKTMEVSGQEILTRDKVSLRANLSAAYQVTDPVRVRQALTDVSSYLYRELQFALRQAIGTRTLDTLLGNKGDLDQVIHEAVRDKVSDYGLEVLSVGVKDVILPGEMKEILNQVVQAEKTAQANNIRRREETAATRSLLNTARLMDENPILVRLKELEVLEKVTEKIDKLTVFGGLDGIMQDVVKINVHPD